MRRSRALALLGGTVLVPRQPAQAQAALAELSVAFVSPAASELSLFIADKQGFFRDEGLHVTLVASGSPANVVNLVGTGSLGIAVSSTDSLMGGMVHGFPMKFIAPGFGADPYMLVTAPSITTWQQLKGKAVLLGQKLDVTGISFARMAAAHGLKMDDFDIAVSPSTTARYTGVLSGQVQATMLNQPYDILAQAKGMRVLAASHDYMKSWMFQGIAANTNWLAANRPVAVHFLRALHKAIAFGYAQPDAAVAILVAATNIDPDVGKKSYDLGWRQWRAFDPNMRFDLAGMRAVADGAVGSGILTTVPDLATLYDASLVAEAVR
ncbi:MAG TPA: ABC transporter substrate-binding protein [Candidatus Lustribacter sp.]|jgi:NitT/TauT family transport system substrate-binding protein|nr:ABC transporter substrate-binding protein [Candidatus Lustribacter sp.]